MIPINANNGEGFAYDAGRYIYYSAASEDVYSVKALNGLVLNNWFPYFHGIKVIGITTYLVFTKLHSVGEMPFNLRMDYVNNPDVYPCIETLFDYIRGYNGFRREPDRREIIDIHKLNWGMYNCQWFCFDPVYAKSFNYYLQERFDFNKIIKDFEIPVIP